LDSRRKEFAFDLLFLLLPDSSNHGVLSHRIIGDRLLQVTGLFFDLVVQIYLKSDFLKLRLCSVQNNLSRSDMRLLQCMFLVDDSLLRVVLAFNQRLYFLIVEPPQTTNRSAGLSFRADFRLGILLFLPPSHVFFRMHAFAFHLIRIFLAHLRIPSPFAGTLAFFARRVGSITF
jgi:hypothetical protein